MTVLLNEANEELDQFVAEKDFVKAGEIQQKIDEAKLKKDELNKRLQPVLQDSMNTTQSITPERVQISFILSCVGTFVSRISLSRTSLGQVYT